MNLSFTIKKYFLPALLVAALLVALLKPTTDSLRSVGNRIQNKLNDAETLLLEAAQAGALGKALLRDGENFKLKSRLEEKGYLLYLYQGDSLVSWTSNLILPQVQPDLITDGTTVMRLKNGWYQLTKVSDSINHAVILGLLPVKYDYPFQNKFLKNEFAQQFDAPHNIELSTEKIEGGVAVKNLTGNVLFSLYVSGDSKDGDINYILLIAQFVFMLLVFYYVQQGAIELVQRKGFLIGFGFLLGAVIILRGIMLWFDLPGEFYRLSLFSPRYYASSVVTKSLGDLIINSLLVINLVLFHTRYAPEEGRATHPFLKLQNIAFVFAYTWLLWWVFKTLVIDSTISFEVYNILSLDFFSGLGLVCIALLLISHYIITNNIVKGILQSGVKTTYVLVFTLIMVAVFVIAAFNSAYRESLFYSAIWAGALVIISYFLVKRQSDLPVRNLIIYVALYSVLAAYLTENLYEHKERNNRRFFSGKLVTERDFVAEYMFEDVAKRIAADGFVRNFFTNPLISKKEIADRINSLYLGGYFNKYNLKLFAFDAGGTMLRDDDTVAFKYYQKILGANYANGALQYISDTALNYSYLSVIDFADSAKIGSFVLRLSPKIYYGQNVYPELLLGSDVIVSNNVNNYAYAIYQNDKLIAQYGDFPYSYYWNKTYQFTNGDFAFVEEPEWEHSIQHFSNGKKVVVSVPREPVFEPIATFSYFFTFFFIMVLLLVFFWRMFTATHLWPALSESFALSFRTRINFSMLVMIVFSFIIIGIITIGFFSRQYDNFYTDRLLRKEKVVHASLEYYIQKGGNGEDLLGNGLTKELDFEVARLADINAVDINLFNKNGDLTISSQPAIYDKGLVSKKMNPAAYFELEKNKVAQVTAQEAIGSLKYQATYAPVRNSRGESVAYIGIPYFEKSKNVNDEVSSFLVALMNVYVFLLICAAVLAYFISNSITRPLTIISDKLRILNLNKINEPIEWNSKDEIGVLVSEYNKMIAELEQSAQKLAKGERESAWREMAKQIAHEIKNPLTPMKLSIQYLQRAIDDGNPNIEQMARKVTKTLEEQIENLSSIATAFSSFAKMPKAQNEIINLNDLLKSITDLFAREENTSVTFTTDSEHPLVFADKNQLVSVFNNLVKNAIQSVPEHRKGFVDVHIKEEDGWITVSVSDNGVGIPADNYDKVFVPNFTTKSSGTGLGLAITKQIIDGAGGRIWFESAQNVGSTFFIRLKKNETIY